ncbi:protein O-mannosyl-transferase TMTC2-like [Daphnia carinata]|uniref:protein O-mannosyl-transferase TMTC2-like n=1 Tax=Daphnia carinata TaxID=120202 RepID=UPI00257B78FB|nr:protein O-mannosyl-transferase TMTC2-like [Daphnia carinata]
MDQTVVLCTLAAFLLYYNTLHADFAYDDSRAIKTNPDVNPSTPWTNLMFNDFWGTPLTHSGSHKSYRPLCVLSFRFNHWLHELQPAGYHLFNVLLHCAATALFTLLARSLLPPKAELATAVAGCLFAAHPIHTEAVAGIVGRADVGAAVFFILAFLSYRRYTTARSKLSHLRRHQLMRTQHSTTSVRPVASNKCSNNNSHGSVVHSTATSLPPFRSFLTAAIFTLIKWNGGDGDASASSAALLRSGGGGGGQNALPKRRPNAATLLVISKWFWLLVTLFFAACSMLTKEHGITVLAVCAVYDVFVRSRLRPKDIFSSVIFQEKHRGLVEGLTTLFMGTLLMVAVRLQLMGSKAPEFAPADNPSADCSSRLTRTLTFLYLPAFNLWLLVQPSVLSFDWSMEAIPLIHSLSDARNLTTATFYLTLAYLGWNALFRKRESDETNGDARSASSSPVPASVFNGNLISSSLLGDPSSLAARSGANGCLPSVADAVLHCYSSSVIGCAGYGGASTSGSLSSSSSLRSERTRWSSNSLADVDGNAAARNSGGDLTVIALSMLVLPFIPATNLFFYVGFVVAERVLYIPSMGYCLLVALGFHLIDDCLGQKELRVKQQKDRHRWKQGNANVYSLRFAFRWGFFALLVVYSARTIQRNQDWLTEETLYRSGISVNPPKAYGNLANILSSTGRKDEAEQAYKKALSYRNNMADVHYNLGILYQEQKRYEEAIQSYRSAVHYRPRMAMAHLNMGLVLALMGMKEEAIEVYRRCSQLDGSGLKDPRTHETTKISALFNLGRLYADDGQYTKAIDVYNEAIQRMPTHYQPQSLYNMLGEAYFKLDRLKDAEHWYREALRAKADHVPAHLTYGKLLTKMNRLHEADEMFLRAKSLSPKDSTVYQHYGQYLSECERHAEAAEQYVRAASLAPTEYEIVFNAANTLRQAGRHSEAEQYYRSAVKIRPLEATSHMNLGAMLHVNGKLIEAEQSYLEALRLKPDDHITRMNLQKLRHLLIKKGMASSSVHSSQ